MTGSYVDVFSQFVAHYGYALIFAGMFLENTLFLGAIFPGMTLLLLGGYYAGLGQLNPVMVGLVGYVGTIMGDNLSYFLGRRGLLELPYFKRFEQYFPKLKALIQSRTEFFLLLFHFSGYGRLVLPAFLGTIRFEFKRWLKFDAAGALLFILFHVVLGYYVGHLALALDDLLRLSRYFEFLFLFLFLWWMAWVVRAWMRLEQKKS